MSKIGWRAELMDLKNSMAFLKTEIQSKLITSLRKFANEVNTRINENTPESIMSRSELEQRLDLKLDKIELGNFKATKAEVTALTECGRQKSFKIANFHLLKQFH